MKDAMKIKVPYSLWHTECFDKAGNLLWTDDTRNQVFDEGINFLLAQFFAGAGYTAEWYVGLIDTGAVFATTDTAADHPGWTENTNYDAAGRPAIVFGTAASNTISNLDSRATFTMNGVGGTIAGSFVISNSTKNGTTGALYAGALFASGEKVLAADAVLVVTVTFVGEDGA